MTNHAYTTLQNAAKLKLGGRVLIQRKSYRNELGWDVNWDPGMDKAVGMVGSIIKIDDVNGVQISVPGVWGPHHEKSWWYPFFILKKVRLPKAQRKEHIKINGDYTAIVSTEGIKVGCQTFPLSVIDELAKAIKQVKS